MPQPFMGPHSGYAADALSERPHLAKHVGAIAAMWAYLENRLSDLLGAMLRADKYTGALMFASVKSEPARLAVMHAIANDRLSPGMAKRFLNLKERITRTGNERDRVVHGLWAVPINKPNSIIWIDSRSAAILNAMEDVTRRKGSRMSQIESNKLLAFWRKHEGGMREYTERDFIDIENRIRDRLKEIKEFDLHVWWLYDRRQIRLRRKV